MLLWIGFLDLGLIDKHMLMPPARHFFSSEHYQAVCIHSCGPQEYDHGMPHLVQIQSKFGLVVTSHGHILGAHMNKCILFNYFLLYKGGFEPQA